MLAGDFTAVASAGLQHAGRADAARAVRRQPHRSRALQPRGASRSRGGCRTTTDPCGRVGVTNPRSIDEQQAIGRVDFQLSQNHSIFGRYMATTYFFDPPFAESENILSTTIGGRDNLVQSVAVGDTMVLSNTVVNNMRFAFNRSAIHRTHVELLRPDDVGINTFSYLPNYMLVSVTGGFNLGGGTENDAIFHTNTYTFSDDLTMIRGNHQFGLRRAVRLLGFAVGGQRAVDRHVQLRRRRHRACRWPTSCSAVRSRSSSRRRTRSTSSSTTSASTAQDTWKLSPTMTLNYGVRWEPWFPQQHDNGAVYNFSVGAVPRAAAQHGVPAGAARVHLSR